MEKSMLAQVTQIQDKSTLLVKVCRITNYKDVIRVSPNGAKHALFRYVLSEENTDLIILGVIYSIYKLTRKNSCF